MLVVLMASVLAGAGCEGFFADLADRADVDGDAFRYEPPPACSEAIAAGEVDVDAAVRALPTPAQRKAACRLGSAALADVRRAVLFDPAVAVSERGRCLAKLLPTAPRVADELAFLAETKDDEAGGRRRVSPIIVAAADQVAAASGDERAAGQLALLPILERALSESALDRWSLGESLCAQTSTTAQAPVCAALARDRQSAETRTLAQVAGIGGAVSLGVGVGAGVAYVVPALLLADTAVAVPIGALGGAFIGAVVGGALGVVVGLPFAAAPPKDGLRAGDFGLITLPLALAADVVNAGVVVFATTAAGIAVGVAAGAIGGGVAASVPGAPRTVTFVAGGVGLAVAAFAVGVGVTWGVAAEADPHE